MSLLDVLDQFNDSGSSSGRLTRRTVDPGFMHPYTGGSTSDSASSSQERSAPERIDINKYVPGGFGTQQPQGEQPAVPMQALEVAGRAPGFIAERPLALANSLLRDDSGQSPLDALGDFGPIKLAGEVLGNISGLPSAITNSATMEILRTGTQEGWSDDHEVLDNQHRTTWGAFKANAAQRGFTSQDVEDVMAGHKATTDYGDHRVVADPFGDMLFRIGSDPTNLLFGIGAAAKIGSGVGLLSRAVRAGAMLEKPLAPSLAAAAARQGIAQESTWMGLARYFGQMGRGVGYLPGGELATRGAATALSATAKGLGAYKKVALATTGAQLGIGAVDRLAGGSGFLEPLFQLNERVWDDQPLSQSSAFALFSAFHFDPIKGVAKVKNAAGAVKRNALGSSVRSDVIKALGEGEGWAGKGSRSAILDRLGGDENLDNLIVHTHSQIIFERLMKNPVIKASLTHYDSLDEAILANHKLGEMIDTILTDEYKNNRISGKQTVEQMKRWHANRSGIEQGGLEFPWDGLNAVDRWVEYGSAAAPVASIFKERGDVVLGLVENVMAEDLRHMGAAFRVAGGEAKSVPIAEVRRWLSRYPQMVKDEWWGKYLTHEFDGQNVPYGKLQGKLSKAAKEAPTARDVTREMGTAEKAAARDEFNNDIRTPADFDGNNGATLNVSRMRPQIAKRLHLDATHVDDVQGSRAAPEVAAFEGRVGSALTRVGFDLDHVTQSITSSGGRLRPAVEIAMPAANLSDLRLAAALVGNAGKADQVAFSIAGKRLQQLGLRPNGYEVRVELPSVDKQTLQSVNEVLAAHFPDFTMNDTIGVARIAVRSGDEKDLAARLAALGPELEASFPKDLVGDTGIATSVHPAYVETITKTKGAGDGTYASVISAAHASGDARAGAADSIRTAVSHSDRAPGDAGPGVGPEPTVGPVPGDGGRAAGDRAEPVAGRAWAPGTDAPKTPGYLYHTTTEDALGSIATEGLKPRGADFRQGKLAWYDGGTGARVWLAGDPIETTVFGGDTQPLLRVREADAGRVRRDRITVDAYTQKRIAPGLIEIYGSDGQWHPLTDLHQPPLEPDIAAAAEQTAPAFRAATDGPFDPTPDPLTAGLRAMEDKPWPVKDDGADLKSQLAQGAGGSGDHAAFTEAERKLEAASVAKDESSRGQVLWQAERDADVNSQIPLHRSLHATDETVRTELEPFEKILRDNYPAYTLKKSPVPAILDTEKGGIAARYLRDRTMLGNVLADWGPFGRINRIVDWLATPVKNSDLGRAARQSLMNELLPHGAKPREVDEFLARLEKEASVQTFGPWEFRLTRNGQALTQQAINKIATGDKTAGIAAAFSPKTVEAIGRDNFARVLDRASNRFIRTATERTAGGGKIGTLAHAVDTIYSGYQHTVVGDATRLVSKTAYHLFRFFVDPRYHAMNALEADFIGGIKYGIGATHFGGAHKAKLTNAAIAHEYGHGTEALKAISDDTGWLWNRRNEGFVSRAFDPARAGSEMDVLHSMATREDIVDLKEIVRQQDLRDGRTVRTPEEIGDDDLVQGMDRMLYAFDTKGAKKTLLDEAEAILGHEETLRLLPFLQKVWERNDQTFHDVKQLFTGNPNRTNLERVGNSVWLYWPLSYQVKAAKWLVSVMTDGAFGKKTNLAGAALYAHHLEEHRKRLARDPDYVAMFKDHPTAWFLAQMMLPITPGDIGVSLSRPIRYAGGALGIWGEYKSAEDPVTAAGAILSLGPVYTAELLARLGREVFKPQVDGQ